MLRGNKVNARLKVAVEGEGTEPGVVALPLRRARVLTAAASEAAAVQRSGEGAERRRKI